MSVSMAKKVSLVKRARPRPPQGHIELRPGNCFNADRMCDCLSGTRKPLVDFASNRRNWH